MVEVEQWWADTDVCVEQGHNNWGSSVLCSWLISWLTAEVGMKHPIYNKPQKCDWVQLLWLMSDNCVLSPKNIASQNGGEISQRVKPWKGHADKDLRMFCSFVYFLLFLFVPSPQRVQAQIHSNYIPHPALHRNIPKDYNVDRLFIIQKERM